MSATIARQGSGIANSAERQKITLSNGEEISARLRGARQRPECRPAPHARHRAPGHQRMPFDLDGLRPRAGRPRCLRLPGPDLLFGQADRRRAWPISRSFRSASRMRANIMFAYREIDDPWLQRNASQAPERDDERRAAAAVQRITGEFEVTGDGQDPPGRSLCQLDGYRQPGIVLVGRRLRDHLPGYGHRHRQGVHRRGTPVQRPYPGIGLRPRAWTTTRSRHFYDDPVKRPPASALVLRQRPIICVQLTIENGLLLAARSAGRGSFRWFGRRPATSGYATRIARSVEIPASLLLVVLILVVVFIVVIGLTGRVMRLVALVVPELAIGAVGGEQLRVRAALDRLAA